MNYYMAIGQCEACEQQRPQHREYGLCEECVRERGWPDEPDDEA